MTASKSLVARKAKKKVASKTRSIRLESLSYSEYIGAPKEWILEKGSFAQVNLIVGRNSSGKSRLLNVIAGLANLLTGRMAKVFASGSYKCQYSAGKDIYEYSLDCSDGGVTRELLALNGSELLKRGKTGAGVIWAQKLESFIDFEAPRDQLAAKVRRDKIQHPFFEDLHTWASLLRHYQFGTSLGRDRLMVYNESTLYSGNSSEVTDASEIHKLYSRAYEEFGKEFDKRILTDLRSLGYDCTDVGAELVDSDVVKQGANPLVWLFVKERGLRTKTPQLVMSQGMFRALALVIHLNYCVLRKIPRTLLIDDIGEGLDFSRAQSFIALLIKHSIENELQLIMTSNDRFVMNGIDLEHWTVIKRDKSTVRLINQLNSPEIFRQFKELGLNNFDFFSTDFFEEGLKNEE